MRQVSIKIIILLQVALYLLGGHATAHGLAWCINSEGRAHVATVAGCVIAQDERSCTTAGSCVSSSGPSDQSAHSGVECRHLPVTSPHATSASPAQKVESAEIVALLPASVAPTWRRCALVLDPQHLFLSTVNLPRTVALVSLRTTVLVI